MSKDEPISTSKLNTIRASIMGANDGIVSVAGLVLGIAGSQANKEAVLVAGIAGLVSGALSIAAGDFVSVSSERDSRDAYREHLEELAKDKRHEVKQSVKLTKHYISLGMSQKTTLLAAKEVGAAGKTRKALGDDDFDENEFNINPWISCMTAATTFTVGAAVPLLTVVLAPEPYVVVITVITVIISLIVTGVVGASAGKSSRIRAAIRITLWGLATTGLTYSIGLLTGVVMG